jgi:hypothetical protein
LSARRVTGASLVTMYSLVMPWLGCATRCAHCPSLVTSSSPVVAESSRPTGTRRGGNLHTHVQFSQQQADTFLNIIWSCGLFEGKGVGVPPV